MPQSQQFDLTKEHVICYVCNDIVQYDTFQCHYIAKKHRDTHGGINFDKVDPIMLFDISRIPERTVPVLNNISSEQGSEQSEQDDESLQPIQEDQDYKGAGMLEDYQVLMNKRSSNN